ncbi:purine-nucleoside phosphorylase [Lactonifactor longoviformis]|uniref:purine-nucleoside phosphorylase n=1 Tax=Lactonifactor TaxID=420345 RepID=UPI0012AF8913|nr:MULTISPECIES: purine-nucleoside phosphorylase [Lactonifactor]MCB5712968.1 purine-nucleoside phosphorylase [Lactonifactor longoviformis]MCB5717184.1 purine-nucleoside phosphorylase [Lactonifactor longoviformis]MCQ4672056.1 purine-nucleoside phosphorylase [Lactonifactor longoviformis]MSA03492.1 purine-nucleoside phosphorylase [Lactonifactor sp. BIOML-A5]MSA09851.1 purine-nucleoside phosphorylase [Lactonifactor sp. BIOML-A4]
MNPAYKKLMKCYDCFQKKINFKPRAALVLGSGLGDYAETIQIADTLDYKEIEGFPVSTIPGHRGRFVFGYVGEVPVVIMQGRVHYYEGYPIEDVVLPVRLMKLMGAELLFLTNAAGGVNSGFQAGDFMMITDHISNFVPSPLIGENIPELGERFSDMSQVYDRELQEIIEHTAAEQQIPLQKGVYIQLTGPNFETPHEVKMCRILGADAVGMSTACEAMAANHMGMKICGISCITNLGCGMTDQPLSHLEVQEIADKAAPMFKKLVTESILAMNKIL